MSKARESKRKPRSAASRVRRRIKILAKRNRTARRSHDPNDRYAYLAAVARRARLWSACKRRDELLAVLGISNQPEATLIDQLIDELLRRTSGDDRRLRHKHSAALKYARSRGVEPDRVAGFIQKRGGFNKCAERYRRRKSQ